MILFFFSLWFIGLSFAQPDIPNNLKKSNCQEAIVLSKENSTTANDLNIYGMRCYKENKLEEASQLFRRAVTLDENHVLAHYNLACVLARLLDTVGPCEMNDEWFHLFSFLQRSITLDQKRSERARKDTDFDGIRYMLPLRLSIEGQPTTSVEMASLFDGVTLWGETPGVATLAEIRFVRSNSTALTGTVEGWMLDGEHKRIKVTGTWRAVETKIIVDWSPTKTGEIGEYLQSIKGWTEVISLDKMNQYGGQGGWYSTPDWCSA